MDGGGHFQAAELCEQAGLPEPFTRKVLQSLVHGGFLKATSGPGGGYALTNPPEDITVLEVMRAVDGSDTMDGCIMGLEQCGSDHPCPLHPFWGDMKAQLLRQLESTTLRDVITASRLQQSEQA